jgi:hypothetical protein
MKDKLYLKNGSRKTWKLHFILNINSFKALLFLELESSSLSTRPTHHSQQPKYLINPLKTKRDLFYIGIQCVPRSKHYPLRLWKPISIYKTKVAVCSEIRTKHVAQCEHHVEFMNAKPGDK